MLLSHEKGRGAYKTGVERESPFPFSAIVGQDLLKLALILNTINPSIGGLLIKGEKGSGKSTAVRALTNLLPTITVVKDCAYSCTPDDPTSMCDQCKQKTLKKRDVEHEEKNTRIVTLPLGATEDRVVGSIDIQKALGEGSKAFQPGILAEANRNVLYIDEVNLLPDHLVDDILDAAASGWNVVEREGISIAHPSKFILIGTMNPEEGELRPQLLDRLPLSVSIGSVRNVDLRVEVVKRNLEFSEDPTGFRENFKKDDDEIKNRITNARSILSKVTVPEQILRAAAELALRLKVDGHRPDIVMIQVAKAIAAYEGRFREEFEDLEVAAKLTLGHRTRSGGYEAPVTSTELSKVLKESIEISKKIPNNEDSSSGKSGDYSVKGSDNKPYWKSEAKGAQATDRTSRFQSLRNPVPFRKLRLSPSKVRGSFLEKDKATEPQESDGQGKGGVLKSFWRNQRSKGEITVKDDEGGTKVIVGFSQYGGTFEEGEVLFGVEDSILGKRTSP
ncbi:MAG: ATP-binding protein, partial [Nitrososphaerales archaeon]